MTTRIAATCACRSFKLKLDYPSAHLPFDCTLCVCTSCRQSSGSCASSVLPVPSSQAIDLAQFKLSSIKSSKCMTRYFCSTCGAHVMVMMGSPGVLHVSTGILDRTEGVVKWTGCKWVGDTFDGGISVWLNDIIGVGARRLLRKWVLTNGSDEEMLPERILTMPPQKLESPSRENWLRAQCACRGVRFYITRPNQASKQVKSPFPDLIVPYHSHSSENMKDETWWLRVKATKYLSGLCACSTCRLSSGSEVQPWAFIPKCNIFQEDGRPLDFGMGTLKRFESSKGVSREFCSVCGATVFWHCEERPELIDVSTGLLDPTHGARVEDWLEWWTERVSFEELSVSRSLVESLEDGLKTWRQAKRQN